MFLVRTVGLVVLHGLVSHAVADAPAQTMPNTISTCTKWFVAQQGDTCTTATKAGGINLVKFNQWNPDVPKDCSKNFIPGYAYCIGTDPVSSTSQASTTGTATASTKSASTQKSASITATSTANATYSIRNPISTWDITTTSVTWSTFPPKETQAGQPSYCNDWHLVGTGDTCGSIVGRYGGSLRMDDLLDYNPALYDDCSGLVIDTFVCVRIQPQSSLTLTWNADPNGPSIPSSMPYTRPTTPTVDPSFTPEPTQGTLPRGCLAYYQAKPNDRCDNILEANPWLTREKFFAWNSFLDNNCDGMWAGYYYCVAVGTPKNQPDPGTVSTKPWQVSEGIASNCVSWYEASDGDDCDLIVSIFGRFSKEDFIVWNPAVGTSCDYIQDDLFYCVAVPGTPATRTAPYPAAGPTDAPTQSGIAQDCTDLWTVSTLDTCDSIVRAKGISMEDFVRWNPAVGSTCKQLQPGYDVCVKAGASTTVSATITSKPTGSITTIKPTSTSAGGSITTPTPNQGGMIAGCRRFYMTQDGDGCWAISNTAKISLDDFYKWNPAVGTDCLNMWLNQYVCIGLSGPTTTISSGPPVPT